MPRQALTCWMDGPTEDSNQDLAIGGRGYVNLLDLDISCGWSTFWFTTITANCLLDGMLLRWRAALSA